MTTGVHLMATTPAECPKCGHSAPAGEFRQKKYSGACVRCGAPWKSHHSRTRFCSSECQRAAYVESRKVKK